MNPEIIQKDGYPLMQSFLTRYTKQLLEDAEMLSDIRTYDCAKAKAEESFPAELVYRITLAGENPIRVLARISGINSKTIS